MYVAPERWSRGVGTVLATTAIHLLSEQGCRGVTLWVLEANERARCFYKRLGFAMEPGTRRLFERDGATAPLIRYRRAVEDGFYIPQPATTTSLF